MPRLIYDQPAVEAEDPSAAPVDDWGEQAVGCMEPREAVETFLNLLGKNPATTYFRTVTPGPKRSAKRARRGADLLGFDFKQLKRENSAANKPASVYVVIGCANGATGENKKTGKPSGAVWDPDIQSCPALFAEWDDGSIEEQLEVWRELKLPEPSIIVLTGGKSVHCYWVLVQPMPPDEWRVLQKRLIDYCDSDPQCCNPSLVMRLPGFAYIDKKTGRPTGGRCELVRASNARYRTEEIAACLPTPQARSTFQLKKVAERSTA